MCIIMSKTIQEERLRWVVPIVKKKTKLIDAARLCPYGRRTLERWVSAYREHGAKALVPKSTRPKTNPRETHIRLKERVIEVRRETGKCALKIGWQLEREGLALHPRTIGKILKHEGLTRKYKVRRVKYKYIRALLEPGELIEIDVKYVPQRIGGKRYYQYTAIDCASRWRYLAIYDEYSNYHTIGFLKEVIRRFPGRIRAIKTDNHSTFTNRTTGYWQSDDPSKPRLHDLDLFCRNKGIMHYLIDAGKPQQNGKVERSHRSDQESFYDVVSCTDYETLKYQASLWNMYYNNLEHCGLGGQTPVQYLRNNLFIKPPNVCA
jgi:transposase InsO family protein